ncbi:GNAT family N-acetyltransferase [Spirillospora sp. NPDC049024]
MGRLGVVPDLRGRGLGRWLLRMAEAVADPACHRIVLSTGAGGRNNIALCQSEGKRPAPLSGDDGTVRLTKESLTTA